MDGVSTGLGVCPPGVLVAIEAQLQVLGKRHGPRVIGQRHHWCHLQNGQRVKYNSKTAFYTQVLVVELDSFKS